MARPQVPFVIIGIVDWTGQEILPRNSQKSLLVRKLSATMPFMRRYRPLPAVVFAIVVSALIGGLLGKSAFAVDDKIPEHYKTFTAALSAIEANYVEKVESES